MAEPLIVGALISYQNDRKCAAAVAGKVEGAWMSVPLRAWIFRADELLIPACRHAAADRLSGDQLVPLSRGQPCRHQVAGMIDELAHVLAGHRAVERHGVAVPLAEVVTGP